MSQFYGQVDLPFMTFTLLDLETTFELLAHDKFYGYIKRKGTKA